jgi:hypothetical protein
MPSAVKAGKCGGEKLGIDWFDHGTDDAFGFLALRMDSA